MFNAKLRNQIRKAKKSGLQFVVGHLEILDGFYAVFARNMRDLGTPVYGKSFFRNILEVFPDIRRIFAVYHETRMIAAGIGSWFRNTLEIPWASSIRDSKCSVLTICYWEAIRFTIRNGLNRLDFGRSTPNEGTYNFKKQWGAQPVQLQWQYLMEACNMIPDLSPSNPKYQAAIRIWQRLPLPQPAYLGR
jgi:serine/alanine adding enzyme